MKLSIAVVLLSSLAAISTARKLVHNAQRQAGDVSPVSKVLELLSGLEQKINKDAELENGAYTKFKDWCENGAKDKKFEIITAKASIEDLTATIGKAKADISSGGSKIDELAGDISTNDADLKAATQIREKEAHEFLATETELMDVVDTLDRAINILERKLRGSALLQAQVNTKDINQLVSTLTTLVDAAALSLHDKKRLIALAQNAGSAGDGDDAVDVDAALGAPAPDAYKGHSDSIIDVLEDLREKAETELGDARKQEANSHHNYAMLKQSLDDQITYDNKQMSDTKANLASATETKAAAEGDLTVTQKDLADGEAALELMESSCATAASDHEASLKGTAEELQALAAAKKTISEMTAPAASTTYGDASFLQIHGSHSLHLSTRSDLANFEVVNLIKQLAKKEKSAALAQLASRVASVLRFGAGAGEDPFAKVKAMISEMIARLEEQAGSEASHKAYCDKEMGNTQEKIDELTSNSDSLTAKLDKKKALAVGLKEEVRELQGELAQLAKSQASMDAARSAENQAYSSSKTDVEQGLQGVRMALKVLKEYYAAQDGGSDAAMLQSDQPEVPVYHSKSTGAGQGIVGMLEVIESDFGKKLAEDEMAEDTAASEYQKISMTNKITKVTKTQDVEYKTKEAAQLDKTVAELTSDAEATQTELDAVLEYSKSIRGACVAKPETYEERKGRREAEVAGLQDALKILNGEALGFMQEHKAGLRGARH